jgi:hypothetical protein
MQKLEEDQPAIPPPPRVEVVAVHVKIDLSSDEEPKVLK